MTTHFIASILCFDIIIFQVIIAWSMTWEGVTKVETVTAKRQPTIFATTLSDIKYPSMVTLTRSTQSMGCRKTERCSLIPVPVVGYVIVCCDQGVPSGNNSQTKEYFLLQ